MISATMEAKLVDNTGALVATVQVPAFPGNPEIVSYRDELYKGGQIGYGTSYVTYQRCNVYVIPQ